MLARLPATARDLSIPVWISGALSKATERDPEKRYEVLSALVADLARPNPDFERAGTHPLVERNPVAFWKWLTLLSLSANVALLFALGPR
jgi:hypothetical protein